MSRRFGDGGRRGGAVVLPADMLDEHVLKRVHELLQRGCLVSLSMSRDQGAMALTVTSNGEWEREWHRTSADAVIWLDEVLGLLEDVPPSPPPGTRSRRPRGR